MDGEGEEMNVSDEDEVSETEIEIDERKNSKNIKYITVLFLKNIFLKCANIIYPYFIFLLCNSRLLCWSSCVNRLL